jgi:pimeloyl-ACP methyl ester carboxylesterase
MRPPTDFAFLHGGVQGGWVWTETLAALELQTAGAFGRALALDIPGCGAKRGRPTEGLDLDVIAAELAADIDAAGLSDVVLVGHSQAGTVLPRLLALRPRLFRRVVYVSCIAPLPGQTAITWRDEIPAPPMGELREVYLRLFCNDMAPDEAERFLARVGQDAWPEAAYTVADWRYEHLGAIPASYFVCLRDAAVPVPYQERFAARLKASSLVRFDSGHQLMNTRPHALAEALLREADLG